MRDTLMRKMLFVLLLGGLLLFAGCASQPGATGHVCPDGTVVGNPANCPAGGTTPETSPAAPTTPPAEQETPQQEEPPEEEQVPATQEEEPAGGCNYLIGECPEYALDEKAVNRDGIEVTLSGPEEARHCRTDLTAAGMDVWDFGYYHVLSVNVKNGGREKQYVSYANFILVDSLGAEYRADSYVNGENCEDAREFEAGDIAPGSSRSGELWFERGGQRELPDGEKKVIFDPNGVIDGDELVFLVP